MNRGRQAPGTKEPPLIVMVEKYLADNSNLSYINIDDMVDCFRSQYFRWGRLPRNAFATQVRNAYFDYCQRKKGGNGKPGQSEGQGGPKQNEMRKNIHFASQPAVVAQQEVNSDVEEVYDDEEYQPRNDLVNANVTAMYKTNAAKSPNPKVFPAGENAVSTTQPSAADCSKNGPPEDDEESSDDDLEIVDEVPAHSTNNQKEVPLAFSAGGITITKIPPQQNGQVQTPTHSFPSPSLRNDGQGQMAGTPTRQIQRGKWTAPITATPITTTTTEPRSSKNVERPDMSDLNSDRKMKKRKVMDENSESEREPMDGAPTKKQKFASVFSNYSLKDFAGSEKVVEEVCRLLMHLKHPEVYNTLGVTAPRGFLLHGPPGVGKTLLANCIAGELKLPLLKAAGTEFISGISGESEGNIREVFNQALSVAPSIIFIDEIDSITPKRDAAKKDMERRIVAQLLSCIDELVNHEKGSQVLLIGATNRVEAIDSSLRRAGRFDKEICLGIPDVKSRRKILEVVCKGLRLAPGLDLGYLAKLTPGYVGADLLMLVREAAVQAVNKVLLSSGRNSATKGDDPQPPNEIAARDPGTMSVIGGDQNHTDSLSQKQATAPGENEPIELDGDSPSSLTVNPPSQEDEKPAEEISTCGTTTTTGTGEFFTAPDANTATPEVMNADSSVRPKDSENASSAAVENMELDSQEESSAAKSNTGSDNQQEQKGSNDTVIEENVDSYLRWIQETAPLSSSELDDLYIFIDDFEFALKHVQPSSKREGFATVPDTTWDDIGALKEIRDELEVSILGPVKYPQAFEELGLTGPSGVLLCGPPGCGKTLLAKAVANEAGINFISVKGPELLNMYVGESERAVRQCFIRAQNSSPCVIFFDEIDALCPKRTDSADGGSGSRIVNQLLTEMDGVEGRKGVFIMAATNRPDILDPAILRPGRLDKVLFVDLPSAPDRYEILQAVTKVGSKPRLSDDVDLKQVAEDERCQFYTGADLAALVREASVAAFRELVMKESLDCKADLKVAMRHFTTAFSKTKPSVNERDRAKYLEMKRRYASSRGN